MVTLERSGQGHCKFQSLKSNEYLHARTFELSSYFLGVVLALSFSAPYLVYLADTIYVLCKDTAPYIEL